MLPNNNLEGRAGGNVYTIKSRLCRRSFDSSVGRAEDCRRLIDILRSLVQIRLEGILFLHSLCTLLLIVIISIGFHGYQNATDFASLRHTISLKKHALVSHPIRSKSKTNSLVHVFLRFASATRIYFKF